MQQSRRAAFEDFAEVTGKHQCHRLFFHKVLGLGPLLGQPVLLKQEFLGQTGLLERKLLGRTDLPEQTSLGRASLLQLTLR